MKIVKNILKTVLIVVMALIIIVGAIATVLQFADGNVVDGFANLLTTLVFAFLFVGSLISVIDDMKNNESFTFTIIEDDLNE